MKSYIHDARFTIEQVCLRGKTLQIAMERDRWELYEHLGKLVSIFCDLTLNPVLAISWESNGKLLRKESLPQDEEFAIREVYLGESYWDDSDKGEIVFSGHGKRPSMLRITVSDLFSIQLADRPEKKPSKRRVRLAR